jgi:hypothetical protein
LTRINSNESPFCSPFTRDSPSHPCLFGHSRLDSKHASAFIPAPTSRALFQPYTAFHPQFAHHGHHTLSRSSPIDIPLRHRLLAHRYCMGLHDSLHTRCRTHTLATTAPDSRLSGCQSQLDQVEVPRSLLRRCGFIAESEICDSASD